MPYYFFEKRSISIQQKYGQKFVGMCFDFDGVMTLLQG